MQENNNSSGRRGFALTMENLFELMQQVYYTKGQTESRFVSKDGGVINGSITIQGSITVAGSTYAIDTETLNVKDYTITLAKDNEQTLTSMVGMVVPKYDGTNYGFFGWDADGFAYVGDLTDYDGSSAITLANNSSLQKIATIDSNNTIAPGVGKVYLYDSTNNVFKEAGNDSKNYVIRNGELVEMPSTLASFSEDSTHRLVTDTEKSNINKSLYHLGAFDSADGKTRKTRVGDLSDIDWTYEATDLRWRSVGRINDIYYTTVSSYVPQIKSAKYPTISIQQQNVSTSVIGITTYEGYIYLRNGSSTEKPSGKYEYESTVYIYTDTPIEGESILPLDSNMAQMIRQDVVEGLNTFNFDIFNKKSFTTSGNTYSQFTFEVWNDSSLTSQETVFRIWYDGSYPDNKTATISTSKTYYCRIGINGNASDDKTAFKQVYIEAGAYTFSGIFTRLEVNAVIYKKLMLSKGFYEYQPTDYNANKHITNPHAEYLKKKWEDSINILDKSDIKMGGYDGSGTLMTNLNAGYFEAGTTLSYKYTKSFLHEVYLTSQPLPTSGENILQLIHSGIMYEDKEYTFTLTQSGYVGFLIGKNPVSDITIEEAKQIDLCLSYSKEPYDPQEYNPREHITNDEALLVKNEYKKSSNLWEFGDVSVTSSSGETWKRTERYLTLEAGTYTISVTNNSEFNYILVGANGPTLVEGENKTYTFTLSQESYVNFFFYASGSVAFSRTVTYSNIMLNKGSEAKPYQEYRGEIVHKNDMSSETWTFTVENNGVQSTVTKKILLDNRP